jgi:hypothetical protein
VTSELSKFSKVSATDDMTMHIQRALKKSNRIHPLSPLWPPISKEEMKKHCAKKKMIGAK